MGSIREKNQGPKISCYCTFKGCLTKLDFPGSVINGLGLLRTQDAFGGFQISVHAARAWHNMDMQYVHRIAAWICTCDMDVDMLHGDGHATWTWTHGMYWDMKHGHRHAAWKWACCMVMSMLHNHGHTAYPCPRLCWMSMYMLHVNIHAEHRHGHRHEHGHGYGHAAWAWGCVVGKDEVLLRRLEVAASWILGILPMIIS